jgi:TRAP-type C4-dicarboxylate transport system substrate-binding protein
VRATAGYIELMRLADAVPISATLVEAVGLLQRGGMDCEFGTNGWLKVVGYADVVKNFNDQPLGMTGPAVGLLMNRDAWNKLTLEQKKIHLKWASYLSASLAIGQFIDEEESVLQTLQKTKDLRIIKADRKDFALLVDKFERVQRQRNIENAKKFGVKNPAAILDAYAKALTKWRGLSKGIGRDIDKFAAAIQREIYDKVDLNKL